VKDPYCHDSLQAEPSPRKEQRALELALVTSALIRNVSDRNQIDNMSVKQQQSRIMCRE